MWPGRPGAWQDRRAISVPLVRVTRGQPRSLGTARDAWSAPLAAVTAALPKLILADFLWMAQRAPALWGEIRDPLEAIDA
jgi:hypothetical protein